MLRAEIDIQREKIYIRAKSFYHFIQHVHEYIFWITTQF